MKKSMLIMSIITIAVFVLFVLLIMLFYAFIVSGAFAILMPEPPEPQIKYGEFPFSITYEVNGKIEIYEDTLICEYDGVENRGTAGKYHIWKSKLKSGNERITLLKGEDSNSRFEITTTAGSPEYFMGDLKQGEMEYLKKLMDDSRIGFVQWVNETQIGQTITKEEAWDKYKFRIISKNYSKPIENQFETQ